MISGPLVSASEALCRLDGAVVLDARAGGGARAAYEAQHVAGARFVDLEADLSEVGDPACGGRHPLPSIARWAERVGSWGITHSTPVLIYDASNSGMAAARAWWMFHALGHAELAVVDGGFAALCEAGASLEATGVTSSSAAATYPTQATSWPTVDADFVDRIRTDSDWRLLDARAEERYAGRVEPIDPAAGHIDGARSVYWQKQVDETGRFIDPSELRRRYAALLDDVPAERVVCYCGSGVTACHLLLAMEVCGLPGASLYVGSWSEWCRVRGGAI